MNPATDAPSHAPQTADVHDLIRVHGARINHLNDVTLVIPKRRRLTVFTGVSGSGNSSLMSGSATSACPSRSRRVRRRASPAQAGYVHGVRRLGHRRGVGVGRRLPRGGMIAQVTSERVPASHLRDLVLLRRVRDRIDREYDQPLNVEALARDAHMSAGHLSRQFKLAYGESPYSYLMTRRIERAMALLRRGDLSVTEVCFEVGCASLGTFSTRFTELVGISPSAYRLQRAGATVGMPPCVAKQVTKPIRNREAPVSRRL